MMNEVNKNFLSEKKFSVELVGLFRYKKKTIAQIGLFKLILYACF